MIIRGMTYAIIYLTLIYLTLEQRAFHEVLNRCEYVFARKIRRHICIESGND